MYRILNALDLTYKSEMILYQLHSIIFYTSLVEICVFIALTVLFFADPDRLGSVWLTILHLPRGVIGLLVLGKLPKSHDIVEALDFSKLPHSQVSIESLYDTVKFSISVQFMNLGEKGKTILTLYSVFTALCYLMDGVCFIVAYNGFSVPGNEHSELLLLVATLLNFTIDVYYFVWVLNLKSKLPPKIGSFVSDAILGYTKKLTREIMHSFEPSKRAELEAQQKELEEKAAKMAENKKKAAEDAKKKAGADKAAKAA